MALDVATTDTTLFYKDDDDEHMNAFVTTNSGSLHRPRASKQVQAKTIYLPRHSDGNTGIAQRYLSQAELLVGRVAMLAAVLLLGVEVTTGMSLPDQLTHMLR